MFNASPGKPWAAFCMSTYKRPVFLEKQLLSLRQQTFSNFEVIVSDNDPERSGEGVVQKINDRRFKYYSNGENLGMVKSFNLSIERATAEFVVMITDDDPVHIDMLQILNNLSLSYPGYGMYFGSYDRFYTTVDAAKLSGAKVGCNSQLANLNEGSVRIFPADKFPTTYLHEDFGGGIFWSVGIAKREIILNFGGLPDYGSPNMIDCAYVLLAGSFKGAVFINSSLGAQSIHHDNYSFKNANYTHFSKGVTGFYEFVKKTLPKSVYNDTLDSSLKNFTARTILTLLIFAKRNIQKSKVPNGSFEKCIKEIFSISFMKKWKMKYLLAVHIPLFFRILIVIKRNIFKK